MLNNHKVKIVWHELHEFLRMFYLKEVATD